MLGDLALQLLQEARRCSALDYLPGFSHELVRAVIQESQLHNAEFNKIIDIFGGPAAFASQREENPGYSSALLIHHFTILRNKRILLAYVKCRVDRIKDLCWNNPRLGKSVISGQADPIADAVIGDTEKNRGQNDQRGFAFSTDEDDFYNRYTDLLAAYRGQWPQIDLSGPLEPPKDIFIDVRVLCDAGEFQTEYGSIYLTKGSQIFVRQTDVEHLIKQGYLENVS